MTDITVLHRGVSPRVIDARVTTDSGSQTVAHRPHHALGLGLRDTWFTVTKRQLPAVQAARLVGG